MGKTLGACIAILVVLSGCTDDSSPEQGRSSVPTQMKVDRDTSVVEPRWTLKDLEPIGQPIVVEGADDARVAVVIAKETNRRLKIVGVDVAGGKQLWSHRFSPNQALPGYPVTPVTSETEDGQRRVIFFLAAEEPLAVGPADFLNPVVSVDPVSGDIETRSRPVQASQPPTACEDGTDACLPGNFDGSDTELNLRLDLDGRGIKEIDEGAPPNSRLIGDAGLFSTYDRPGEELGVQREGKTLWKKSLEDLVGKGYSTDGGWAFTRESRPDRYTGYVGRAQDDGSTSQVSLVSEKTVVDLGREVMVSFTGSDGDVLWTRKGVERCFTGPYGEDEETVGVVEHPFRCKVAGKLTYDEGRIEPEIDGLSSSIEGYRPASGETTWSHRLSTAAAKANRLPPHGVFNRSGARIVADLREGLAIVDVATGKLAPASGPTFMCQAEPDWFPYAQPWGGSGDFERYGAGLLYACLPDGTKVDSGMTAAALTEGAVMATDTSYVLASEDGLVGYRIGGR
ncbi:hypothetical protein [Aeromicrobium sp.]|uniref:hypothetical protein n=1 Tax=Aeromicrobium sp. TaxID=1871063 RepID=UPI003D6A0E18